MKHYHLLCLLTLTLLPAVGRGADLKLSGYMAVEGRFFTEEPAFDGQDRGPQFSGVAEPEFSYRLKDGAHQFKLTPFYRLDGMDAERTHFDLREAYWRYSADAWELLVGINKVFWGVAESRHLVDIINQTDILEDIDQEDKLGQPMIMLASQQDWGEVQFYLMPYFREQSFAGRDGRLRPPLPVDGHSQFESDAREHHPDLALRYSHYIGNWDIGGYYFHGTSREPILRLNRQGTELTPFYEIIHQAGVDLQYTRDAWLWKFEGIVRDGRSDFFGAVVGGFEYTFYQVLNSPADWGLLVEYNRDGRDEVDSPATAFDNDIFFGTRLALNDPQDTSLLLGAVIDTQNGSTLANIEAERRIGASLVLEVTGRFFLNIDDTDPVKALEQDDFIEISLQYHF